MIDVRRVAMRTLAAALAGLTACNKAKPEAAPQKEEDLPAVAVTCATVTSQPVSDDLTVRGVVAPPPAADAVLSALIAGRITALSVDVGDRVSAGQVVARVEDPALAAGTREAQAAVAAAQAELTSAGLARARLEKLLAAGIAARRDLDDAIARDDTASADLAAAKARASSASGQAARAMVRSPRAGVVLHVLRRTGEAVDGTPGTPILEIADVRVLELHADVRGADLVRLAPGATTTVTLDALPGTVIPGQLVMVAPAIDPATGRGEIRIRLSSPPEGIRLAVGLTGTATVVMATNDAIVVPLAALRRNASGADEVVVCAGDPLQAAVKEVQVGRRQSTTATVVEGLTAGGRIVVDHALGLSDGQPLTVEHGDEAVRPEKAEQGTKP